MAVIPLAFSILRRRLPYRTVLNPIYNRFDLSDAQAQTWIPPQPDTSVTLAVDDCKHTSELRCRLRSGAAPGAKCSDQNEGLRSRLLMKLLLPHQPGDSQPRLHYQLRCHPKLQQVTDRPTLRHRRTPSERPQRYSSLCKLGTICGREHQRCIQAQEHDLRLTNDCVRYLLGRS